MSTFTQFCGIDVSKDTLDFCLMHKQSADELEYRQIPNTLAAIKDAFTSERFCDTLFIVEHTGSYSAKLLYQLPKMERRISVVSPLQSKDFMSCQGITNKNDRQACRSLAMFGQVRRPRLYKAPPDDMLERRQKLATLRGLEKQERMLKNQLHALNELPLVSEPARAALESVLHEVQAQLGPLREGVCGPSKTPGFDEAKSFASSVKGIGAKTAEAVLLATNGLEGFENHAQVSKFLGLTPLSHHSGSSVRRRGGISRFGSSDIRGLLYMCTKSAIRYNLACKNLYERLRGQGKPHKVAAVAVMHKLIKQLFACVKNKTMFDNEYHLSKNKK